jgi:predicted nucleic acid-binding protein
MTASRAAGSRGKGPRRGPVDPKHRAGSGGPVTALDTSVIVAGLLAWHESHEAALRALVQAHAAEGASLVVPAAAMIEAYSVMTRLPAPHRLAPDDAIELLSGSFEASSKLISLTAAETWGLLRELAENEIVGGRGYDALILACARKARATRLLTLDRRDFGRMDTGSIEIVVPE